MKLSVLSLPDFEISLVLRVDAMQLIQIVYTVVNNFRFSFSAYHFSLLILYAMQLNGMIKI